MPKKGQKKGKHVNKSVKTNKDEDKKREILRMKGPENGNRNE